MAANTVWAKDILSTPSSRRHFLATMGKGAALAGLGIFGAGSEAAVRGLFGRGLIPAAWARLNKIYSQSPI